MSISQVKILSPKDQLNFVSGWYDLAQDTHFWMRGRLAFLLKQFKRNNIPTSQALRGLEIGCGHGVLRSQIEQNTNWTIDGTDLDLGSLEHNPPCRGEVYLYNIFDRQHFFKEFYDFIILYDVIEHIDDVNTFMEASLYHLKPGGYVFLNVPALESLTSTYDKVVGHLRRYDIKMMEDQIKASGLKSVHINYWGFSFIPLLLARKILVSTAKHDTVVKKGFDPQNSFVNEIGSVMIRTEATLIPNPILGTSVMAIARKKPDKNL